MNENVNLRDYFAIEILKAMIPMNDGLIVKACRHEKDSKRIILSLSAEAAYEMSDAMLKAKGK